MPELADPLEMEWASLPSGLELLHQAPPASAHSFSISYIAPAGWGFESPDVAGLATVAAKLVVGQPGQRSREALARTLDRLGASLTSTVTAESAELTLWGPEDAWSPLLEIFADAVFRPHFAASELARAQRQLRERQLRQKIQPDLRAERELVSKMFPGRHPYGSTGIGTSRTSARISLDGLRRFHASHYPTRGSVLVVTRRAPGRDVVRSLAGYFRAEELVPDPPLPPLPEPSRHEKRRDVPIPGQSQVAVRIGAPTIARSDPIYPELFLANEVLGGRPLLSRLFQRVREDRGWVYHASSELEALRWGGYWEAVAGTDPGTRDRVVRLMRREIERLSTDLVPSGELERIRESTLGSLPLELETTASAHELAVEVAYHHLPGDFYRTWPDRLRAIRPQELRSAAEAGFAPGRAVVITAGPPGD